MTQSYFNWTWIVLFIIITALRKFHEHRSGKRSSLKNTPFNEALMMMLWGTAAGILPFFYIFTDWLDFASYRTSMPPGLGLLGIALFLLAIWLLHRSHTDLGQSWSPAVELSTAELIQSGVFKFIRHPMYSAHLIWGIAQTLMFPNILAGPMALVLIIITLFIRTPREEQLLLREFGDDYAAYMQKTGRFLPKIFTRK